MGKAVFWSYVLYKAACIVHEGLAAVCCGTHRAGCHLAKAPTEIVWLADSGESADLSTVGHLWTASSSSGTVLHRACQCVTTQQLEGM